MMRLVRRPKPYLRGVCGECDDITDWKQGTVPGFMGRRRAVQCLGCGEVLKQ